MELFVLLNYYYYYFYMKPEFYLLTEYYWGASPRVLYILSDQNTLPTVSVTVLYKITELPYTLTRSKLKHRNKILLHFTTTNEGWVRGWGVTMTSEWRTLKFRILKLEIYHLRFQNLSLSKLEYEIKILGLQSIMMRLLSIDLWTPPRKLI